MSQQPEGPPQAQPFMVGALEVNHDTRMVALELRRHMAIETIPVVFPFAFFLDVAGAILTEQAAREQKGWVLVPAETLAIAAQALRNGNGRPPGGIEIVRG